MGIFDEIADLSLEDAMESSPQRLEQVMADVLGEDLGLVREEDLMALEEVPEDIPAEEPPAETPDPEEDLPEEEEALEMPPLFRMPVLQRAETVIIEDELPAPQKKGLRAELVMGIIAVLAAALLLVVTVLCLPYFESKPKDNEDPEAALHHREELPNTEPPQETILEPTVSETEPEEPTIPPDRNPYGRNDFQYNKNNYLLLQDLDSAPGVDVSAFQGDINWRRVARSGIEFAIIRLGYRGYETGKLVEDEYAKQNLTGAREAGLDIGAYFFSQALTLQEAEDELQYMMQILGETALDLPLVLDWEIPAASARTANMDARTLTEIQKYFCQRAREMGYEPMVYFNWHQSENLYYLSELEEAPFWLALYQDRMTYPWKVEYWQYTDRGHVPGINGNVDLNVYMPD